MISIAEISISTEASTGEAMRIIDSTSTHIALVVDEKQRLLGTITDGDIRRGLLLGESLVTPATRLMNRNFRAVRSCVDQEVVMKMMRAEKLSQIPVLDKEGRVIELLLLQDLLTPPKLSNVVCIMAGGKGSRLMPYTKNCPKPMLPLGGKPMLEILLDQCISSGFSQFYISVNYLKDQIIDYFQDGKKWGVTINYLIEDEPLGTAGSLQLLPKSVAEPFLLLNGDVLTRLDYRQLLNFHYENHSYGTVCVRDHTTTIPFGVVETNGVELAGFKEKPSYRQLVNAGVYLIHPQLLSLLLPNKHTDMPDLLRDAQRSGYRITVCPIHEYWIDVGRPETLNQAHHEWPLNIP